jgi:hypothetical protein
MTFLALFFVVLADTVVKVPPSHWIAIDVRAPQNRTTAHVYFDVQSGGSRIQAILLSRAEAERFRQGRSIRPLYTSGFESSDRFRVLIPDRGDYVLLLDNRLESRFPTQVALRLELSHADDVTVRTVSPERRRATVALSLLFFGAVVVFSAVKFLRR